MNDFDAREEIHHKIVVTLRTRAANSLLLWPVAIGLAWAHTYYTNVWFLYLASILLVTLLFWVSIPNLGLIVTLNTKFYGGLESSIKNTVPIVYLGVLSLIYSLLALWLNWSFPVLALVVSFICALISGLHGE